MHDGEDSDPPGGYELLGKLTQKYLISSYDLWQFTDWNFEKNAASYVHDADGIILCVDPKSQNAFEALFSAISQVRTRKLFLSKVEMF